MYKCTEKWNFEIAANIKFEQLEIIFSLPKCLIVTIK